MLRSCVLTGHDSRQFLFSRDFQSVLAQCLSFLNACVAVVGMNARSPIGLCPTPQSPFLDICLGLVINKGGLTMVVFKAEFATARL